MSDGGEEVSCFLCCICLMGHTLWHSPVTVGTSPMDIACLGEWGLGESLGCQYWWPASGRAEDRRIQENRQDKALSSLSMIKIQVVFFWSSIISTIFPRHSETCSSTSPRSWGDSEWGTDVLQFSCAWTWLLYSSFCRTKYADDQAVGAGSSLICSTSP